MQSSISEKIRSDIRSGKAEETVRSYIKRQQLDNDVMLYLLNSVDDEIAIHQLREVKRRTATLIVYMGYFLMAIGIFFGIYSLEFGASIFIVGIIVTRRGRTKITEAEEIESIEELLPDHPTKFHKRRL